MKDNQMQFEDHIELWAKGDATQGRMMLAVAAICLIAILFILDVDEGFFKGMYLPIGLLFLVNLLYGGFLAFSRPKHLKSTLSLYKESPSKVLETELNKAEGDHKNYTRLRPLWVLLFLTGLVVYFVVNDQYYKGMALGFALTFAGALLIDSKLHNRLKPYKDTLENKVTVQ